MIIRTSYPGQKVAVSVAPQHIVDHLEKFGELPPFIEVVHTIHPKLHAEGFFELVPAAWVNPNTNDSHQTCGARHEGWTPTYRRL
jgi:hypothetical protein